jgi:hypothetical protein
MACMNHLLDDWDDARRRAHYPHPDRILVAMRLARDLDTCVALLQGEPVDPDRLHANEVEQAKQRELVRLDFHAIDLLDAA